VAPAIDATLVTRELVRHEATLRVLGQPGELRIPPSVISLARDMVEHDHETPTHDQRVEYLENLINLILENDVCF